MHDGRWLKRKRDFTRGIIGRWWLEAKERVTENCNDPISLTTMPYIKLVAGTFRTLVVDVDCGEHVKFGLGIHRSTTRSKNVPTGDIRDEVI